MITVPKGDVMTNPERSTTRWISSGQHCWHLGCRGAPAPDQLHKVARRFHQVGADVACLQGRLTSKCPYKLAIALFCHGIRNMVQGFAAGMVKLGFAILLEEQPCFFGATRLRKWAAGMPIT